MSTRDAIAPALAAVREEIDLDWDVDATMGLERARSLAFGRLILRLHELDSTALAWSTFFVARRGLDCWENSLDDRRPRRRVQAMGKHLLDGREIDWTAACRPIPSPHSDCRVGETQAAADAVVQCARYLAHRDPSDAIYCVGSVDTAFDAFEAGDGFRRWWLERAIPIGCEHREMTRDEQDAYLFRW